MVLKSGGTSQLLSLVDRGEADNRASLTTERDRLPAEISNLLDLVATGVSPETLAPKVREREAQVAKLDMQLRAPHREPVNIEKLRAALEQRVEQWKADLRDEPQIARLILRRLIGPISLWTGQEQDAVVEWMASAGVDMLEGLVPIQVVASPTGFEPVF